jgi:hypothetical protein
VRKKKTNDKSYGRGVACRGSPPKKLNEKKCPPEARDYKATGHDCIIIFENNIDTYKFKKKSMIFETYLKSVFFCIL